DGGHVQKRQVHRHSQVGRGRRGASSRTRYQAV
ncbi:uncharacterized protein METZ01_LOCUS96544, partial [marine metagenome]